MKNVAMLKGRRSGLRVRLAQVVSGSAMVVGSLFGASSAFAAGMADGVVTTITAANGDVVLIGTALLALTILIASIVWFKRAANK